MTNIERVSEASCASKDTHTHRGYQKAHKVVNTLLYNRYALGETYSTLDLFARECPWADFRNDLNPYYKKNNFTNMCMDALEAAKTFENASMAVIYCDPPFSPRQAKDKYDEVGTTNLYTNPSYMSELGKEMYRICEPGGFVIKAGFNSNAPDPRFVPVAFFISHYYGSRNDVIFSVWQRQDNDLSIYY